MLLTTGLALLTLSAAGYATASAAEAGPLQVLKTFALGGEGGWDLLTVDPQARRVYVSRATRVMVIDADKGTLLGEVADVNGAHGVAVVPELNLGFATAGKDKAVVVFDLKTFKTVKKIPAGPKADAILYDPASKKVFAFDNSGGGITVIDPAALDKAPVTLAVPGKLELAVADGAGRLYVNVEDKSEVVAIDTKALKVLAHWPIAPGEEPTGVALDAAHKRLFIGCGGNAKMIIVDAETGKVLGNVGVGKGVDGAAFDAQLGLVMIPNGRDGTLSVIKEGPAGEFKVIQTLKTATRAKTVAADPTTHRIYLPGFVAGADGKDTFALLVIGSAEKP
jgi:DNA-binding beta-propeller fold protein YncE